MEKRPNGRRLMQVGKTTLGFGIIAILAHTFAPFFPPGYLDYYPVAELIIAFAWLGTFLGVVAWLVGYLVFALSFTPREDRD
jgi:hypothetical protein